MKAPIHSRKHYVQISQSQVAQAAILNTTIAKGIEGASATPAEVSEGAIVKAVWAEVWVQNASTTIIGSFTAGFVKEPGGSNPLASADAAALHDYDNKKNLFYVTQALVGPNDSNLMLLYKGWIKIPKGKQRMGLNDKLVWFVRNNNATSIAIEVCGVFVYKEFQ